MGLTRPHIPHPHCTVPTPAYQRIFPGLHRPDKVLIQLPASVSIRWRWDSKRARDGKSGQVPGRHGGWRMRNCPEDIHRHYALPRREVPLA